MEAEEEEEEVVVVVALPGRNAMGTGVAVAGREHTRTHAPNRALRPFREAFQRRDKVHRVLLTQVLCQLTSRWRLHIQVALMPL